MCPTVAGWPADPVLSYWPKPGPCPLHQVHAGWHRAPTSHAAAMSGAGPSLSPGTHSPGRRALAPGCPSPPLLSTAAGTNPCSLNNGDCSQLCLPTSETSRSCMCTAGYSLKSGQQSCEGERACPHLLAPSEQRHPATFPGPCLLPAAALPVPHGAARPR